jgi:hypothetical protein
MDPQLARIARNESIFRRVNEAIAQVSNDLEDRSWTPNGNEVEFHCECGREGCLERFSMSVEAYEAAHRERDRFVLVPAHVASSIENVVERDDAYVVVDKQREAERFLQDPPGEPAT